MAQIRADQVVLFCNEELGVLPEVSKSLDWLGCIWNHSTISSSYKVRLSDKDYRVRMNPQFDNEATPSSIMTGKICPLLCPEFRPRYFSRVLDSSDIAQWIAPYLIQDT